MSANGSPNGNGEDPVLVVLQLSGGNDYFNTVIPYSDPNYYDNRRALGIPEEQVLRLDGEMGLHPAMGPMKRLYDEGEVAVIHGIGYENSPRSHFRSMDIWHTCEPEIVGTEGWLGRATRDIDPLGENPVTAVNFGHGLPRALAAPGVSVASVSDLENYGLLTGIEEEEKRDRVLERFSRMYAPAMGSGPVMDYLGKTGLDALKGADILKAAPESYQSTVEYAANPIAKNLRDVAMVHTANLGARIFYTQHGSFDTHAAQKLAHANLWAEVSGAIADFWDDLREHDAHENVIMFPVLRVRQACQGQRVRHRPRRCGRLVRNWAARKGRQCTAPTRRRRRRSSTKATSSLTWTSEAPTLRSSTAGSVLDSVPIVNGRFESLAFV